MEEAWYRLIKNITVTLNRGMFGGKISLIL